MTADQMLDRARRAERLRLRFSEIERRSESKGLYEEALEVQRLRREQEAAARYWRNRAGAVTG